MRPLTYATIMAALASVALSCAPKTEQVISQPPAHWITKQDVPQRPEPGQISANAPENDLEKRLPGLNEDLREDGHRFSIYPIDSTHVGFSPDGGACYTPEDVIKILSSYGVFTDMGVVYLGSHGATVTHPSDPCPEDGY